MEGRGIVLNPFTVQDAIEARRAGLHELADKIDATLALRKQQSSE